jgi:hypothetical protein
MSMELQAAQVPDCDILVSRFSGLAAAITPPFDILSLNLNPFMYRRKLWIACGVLATPASLAVEGFMEYSLKGNTVFRLPMNINAFPTAVGNNVFYGNSSGFGVAGPVTFYDEPCIGSLNNKFIASTPFRSVITADKCRWHIDRHSMAAADTFFCFLAVQQEFPY